MKIDQIGIIPPSENRRIGTRPRWAQGSLLSAESRTRPSEAFVIFIVILLTQFPAQHRYTDMALDLRITKMPCKAIPACRSSKGGGSQMI